MASHTIPSIVSSSFFLNFILLQETYPSTPPVWFAESEETSVTNAVQILSNTNGRDNHVINQVCFIRFVCLGFLETIFCFFFSFVILSVIHCWWLYVQSCIEIIVLNWSCDYNNFLIIMFIVPLSMGVYFFLSCYSNLSYQEGELTFEFIVSLGCKSNSSNISQLFEKLLIS